MNFQIDTVNIPKYREYVEWSNFWYDRANECVVPRLLIIGDSTARMVRSTLAKLTDMPVDLLASSSSIDDALFVNQVNTFFAGVDNRYSAIYIQLGHHGRVNKEGGEYTESDFEKYRFDLITLIDYLRQYTDKIILETIFDAVEAKNIIKYVFCKCGFIKEKFDDTINRITRRKNDIIRDIAQNDNLGGLFFLDINERVNRMNFVRIDHIHFEKKAKQYIANEMKLFI